MVDKVMDTLQRRVNEIRELLHQIDGNTARQMEQEMNKFQEIIDTYRSGKPE